MFILRMCHAYLFNVVETVFATGGRKIIFGHIALQKPRIEIRVLRKLAFIPASHTSRRVLLTDNLFLKVLNVF